MGIFRRCQDTEHAAILAIINSAAAAYRGVIPADQWHEPYMDLPHLQSELRAGVTFWGVEEGGTLIGVMGIQPVGEVDLIRHAYVLPSHQRGGVGAVLLHHLVTGAKRRLLVGTWAAATWAVAFYTRNGFVRVPASVTAMLLKRYWSISDRQAEASVVLACPPYDVVAAS